DRSGHVRGKHPAAGRVLRHPEEPPGVGRVGVGLPVGPRDPQRLPLVAPVEGPGPPDDRLLEPAAVPDGPGPLRRRRPRRGRLPGALALPGLIALGLVQRLAVIGPMHDPQRRALLPAGPGHRLLRRRPHGPGLVVSSRASIVVSARAPILIPGLPIVPPPPPVGPDGRPLPSPEGPEPGPRRPPTTVAW